MSLSVVEMLRSAGLLLLVLGLASCVWLPGFPEAAAQIVALECPLELVDGESGRFRATVSGDSSAYRLLWDWGDGKSSEGLRASHAFQSPGTYTVTARLSGQDNDDLDTCVVTIGGPIEGPRLIACTVSPSLVTPGEPVVFRGRVNSDAAGPLTFWTDWGDGAETDADTLPALHRYREPGTYTATLTAANPHGADSCEKTVTVIEAD